MRAAVILALALAAWAGEPLRVVASVPELGAIARAIGGEDVAVTVLARPSDDPHRVEARPSFVVELARADLLLSTGFELEIGWLPPLVQNARNPRIRMDSGGHIEAATLVGSPIGVPVGPVDRSAGDVHPHGNPHVMLDPAVGLLVAEAAAARLARFAPEASPRFAARLDAFRAALGIALAGPEVGALPVGKLLQLDDHGRLDAFLDQQGLAGKLGGWWGLLRPHAGEKGLGFDVVYCSRIPATVKTDALRLRQILLNLSTNAIKFTDRGCVRIDVSSRGPDTAARLALSVTDTGIGIPPGQLDQLFKPFSQVHLASRRQYGGTGLGLSISQRLAHALGGSIVVESTPGKGSVFTLELPIRQDQELKWLEAHEARQPSKPDLPALARLDDRRILLVEDGPDNQRILSYMLEGAGAIVTVAANGEEGVKAFERGADDGKPFDLVLMDIQMPVMDGYEATWTLRAKGVKTPIVALTAFAMSGDREACLAAGCNDYLPKPITTASLLAKLAPYLHCAVSQADAPSPAGEPEETGTIPVRSRLADDPRFASLVHDFQADLAQRIETLERARQRSDDEAIRTQAHRLKSAAGMLGFDELSAAAARCEQAWREGRADKHETLARLLGWLQACHVGRRGKTLL